MKRLDRTTTLVSAGLLLASLAACSSSRHYYKIYRAAISENQQALHALHLGMSAGQVFLLLGEGEIVRYKKIYLIDPWRSEAFSLIDGTEVLILFYVTQPPRKYYRAEDHELTPIVLENDRVVGWGWSYLRRNTDRYQISTPREQR